MPQPNLEEREQAMDLLFASFASTHLYTRSRHEPERTPLEASPSRHWTFPCPVCGRHVRVNRNRTVAAHFTPAATPTYCAGSREPALYPHDGRS